MRLLDDNCIDAIISDPPYAITDLSWDTPIDWDAWWIEAERICKPDANIILFCAGSFMPKLLYTKRHWFRYELIWEKTRATGFLNANRRPLTCHENILIFRKEGRGTYNPQKTKLEKPITRKRKADAKPCGHYSNHRIVGDTTYTERHPRTVLHFASEGNTLHPTQKPLALMEFLVKSYSNEGDTVFDPFSGSGTTGVAAVKNKRKFLGCELDHEFFHIAGDRIRAAAQ